jgi:hypothetical protein
MRRLLTIPRNICICRNNKFTPVEAFRLGLLKPGFDLSELNIFVSRKETTKLQEALNPPSVASRFKNKANFYIYCLKHSLPIPQLFALFDNASDTLLRFENGSFVPLEESIDEFVNTSLPRKFVVKPVDGSYGHGFNVFRKTFNTLVDKENKHYSSYEFIDYLKCASFTGTIVQQLMTNHPQIDAFSSNPGLQTCRVITLVDNNNKPRIIHAHFKTITIPNIIIDNLINGFTGNVEAPINLIEGSMDCANFISGLGDGVQYMQTHPITNRAFRQFILPQWNSVSELACKAAIAAFPARTIGWDIAITPTGPCIIEGNIWWDPPNQHRTMSRIAHELNQLAESL